MSFLSIFILSLIQGSTEFLPVSSSAHLYLAPYVVGFQPQGIEMDVALHLGTLLSVMVYFRKEVVEIFQGMYFTVTGEFNRGRAKLFLNLVVATIPAIILGVTLSIMQIKFRSVEIIAWNMIIFGSLMFYFDHYRTRINVVKDMKYKRSFLMGLAQAVALFPGASRSGMCLTMARVLNFKRDAAAKFTFLMSIPAIASAGAFTALRAYMDNRSFVTKESMIGMGLSFIFGYIAILFFMKWLERGSLAPFSIYRVIIGVIILYLIYS